MSESDGIDEALEGMSRVALTVAGRLGEQLARAREQELRRAQAAEEQQARELQARFDAERRGRLPVHNSLPSWTTGGRTQPPTSNPLTSAWRPTPPLPCSWRSRANSYAKAVPRAGPAPTPTPTTALDRPDLSAPPAVGTSSGSGTPQPDVRNVGPMRQDRVQTDLRDCRDDLVSDSNLTESHSATRLLANVVRRSPGL